MSSYLMKFWEHGCSITVATAKTSYIHSIAKRGIQMTATCPLPSPTLHFSFRSSLWGWCWGSFLFLSVLCHLPKLALQVAQERP